MKKIVKKTRKYKKGLRLHSVYDGGSAFVKGGFGCIFKPALQCKGNSIPVRKNYVSKLIKTKYGKREYTYVYNIKKKISHLPESIKKYFLLDSITICTPGQLSTDDKKNIEDVCDNILSEVSDGASNGHVDSKNINNNLDKFKIINMPELSISLTNYIKKTKITPIEIIRINNIIIEYISKVIPELYKNGVIHGDIKADNLMFDHSNGNLLLIDWGLSYLQNDDKKDIPEALYILSTQWHHPFSSLLFNKNRINDCNVFLETLKNEGIIVTRENVRGFITSEYKKISVNEKKQINVLNDTLMYAYHNEIKKTTKHHSEKDIKKIINDRVIRLIVEYNTDIFMRFIKDYKLYLDRYCNEVYIMNVDIWGVMSIYVDLIEKLSPLDNNNVKSGFKTTITKIMDKLVNIHIENLYKNGDKVINIPKLVSDIKELNEYLVSIDHGFNKNISVDSKISVKDVNKVHQKTKFSENISILNKLEKYSSTRFNSTKYKKKLLLHSPVDVVGGGKKTRKNRKAIHVS
jgi:serine/threonine protein kinase